MLRLRAVVIGDDGAPPLAASAAAPAGEAEAWDSRSLVNCSAAGREGT